jgi:hypothetical protein
MTLRPGGEYAGPMTQPVQQQTHGQPAEQNQQRERDRGSGEERHPAQEFATRADRQPPAQ